jgi:hypothetical protein
VQLTTLVQDNGSEIGNIVLKPRHAPNFYGCLVLSVELDCFSSKMAIVQLINRYQIHAVLEEGGFAYQQIFNLS